MPGLNGHDANLNRSEPVCDLLVPQIIRREDSLESQFFAQPIGDQFIFNACRQIRPLGHRRHSDVFAHDIGHTRIDSLLEGKEIFRHNLLCALIVYGEFCSWNQIHISTAGIMLGCGQHSVLLIAPYVRTGHPTQKLKVTAKRTDAQHRIIRPRQDIHDRRICDMDAYGTPLCCTHPSQFVRDLF